MDKLCAAIALLIICCAAHVAAGAVQQSGGWSIDAPDTSFTEGIIYFTNGVTVRYEGATLTARRATVDMGTGEVHAEGQVRVARAGLEWNGEKISYNFKTKKILGEDFRGGQPPLFVGGNLLAGDQEAGVFAGSHAFVTSDDYADPHYRVVAKTLVVVPGDYIEARDATLVYRDVPIFYFPYYRRSLKAHPNYFAFVPGYRSQWGPYLLSSYNHYWNERLSGAIHVDGRVKRGIGVGPDLNWNLPRFGEGMAKYYYAHDEDPDEESSGRPIDDDRHRVYFFHQAVVRSNLIARAMLRYQSDPLIVRDFFESEYRDNVQPNSFVEVEQLFRNYDLNLYVEPQVNDFFETVERLPDIKLSGLRQRVFETPLFYESESTVGYYQHKFSRDVTNHFSAFRADTLHQLLLPWNFFGWLNVTPRAGVRYTYYGEADGPGAATDEEHRGVFNTGVEFSTKASRVWPNARSRIFAVDGWRHIVEPSINYGFVPHPTVGLRHLPRFDYELPTTRLLPIEFPDYNAIDSIDAQNVLRFSVRNRLQTKRRDGIEDFVHSAVYTDWRLNPRSGQGTFAGLYSETDLRPFQWLTLSSDIRYDIDDRRLDEANHRATFTPSRLWSLTVGQRYLREFANSGPDSGHNVFFSTIYLRINENWAARMSHHFEGRDGVMEEQQYTIYRDFRSWTGALTFRVREDRDDDPDYTIAITFSFKAFPRFRMGDDQTKPSLLLGG